MKVEIEENLNREKEQIIKQAENIIKKLNKKNDEQKNVDISMWRVCAYFIIYSFLGFVIETLFALFNYGVFESRQSFLYGPFCSIYGVGAVVIILVLKYKFFKNNHTLFIGGFLVGSAVEYVISFFGEMILNVKWWDYSGRFLNINGRICFLYSLFWGLLGVYLLRVVNPKIDKFIDWLKEKMNLVVLRAVTAIFILFLFVDCLFSAYAIDVFLIRVCVENDVPIANKVQTEAMYDEIYSNEKTANFIYKYIGNEKMLITYPNLTVTLEDGTLKKVKEYYPEIKNYYYKFDTKPII